MLKNARLLQEEETARMSALQQARSAAEIRAIFGGQGYIGTRQK